MAKQNRKTLATIEKHATQQTARTKSLAGLGISTEHKVDAALDAIFNDLADERADYEKTRYMLSAIGKKLGMENMKIRAGIYKNLQGTPRGFFLKA